MQNGLCKKSAPRARGSWLFAALALGLAVFPATQGAQAWPQQVGPFIYIAGANTNRISVLDTLTNKIVATLNTGARPMALTAAPNGKTLYVAEMDSNRLSMIDIATNTLIETPVGNRPTDVGVAPDGKTVYVANSGSNSVSMIDALTMTTIATIPVGLSPIAVAVTPDTKFAYVVNEKSNTVSVIDTKLRLATATIQVGAGPNSVAISADGKYAYVVNFSSDSFSVISVATKSVVATVGTSQFPQAIVLHPDGKRAYIYNMRPASVTVFDTATRKRIGGAQVVADPFTDSALGRLAITPDGKNVYATESIISQVSVVDTTLMKTVRVFQVDSRTDSNLFGIAALPAPPGLPFGDFKISHLEVTYGAKPNQDSFNYYSSTTLDKASNGIHPDIEPFTLDIGGFVTTIAPGLFKKQADGSFVYNKWVNSVLYNAYIKPAGVSSYVVHLLQSGVTLPPISNPTQVKQTIGDDSGVQAVKATIAKPLVALSP